MYDIWVPTVKGQQRRDAIVTTAARLLVELGADAVNHRAVAAAAGIGLGTVTYHFPAADDLRRAAADALAEGEIARMAAAVREVPLVRRDARGTAELLVSLLAPGGRAELLARFERDVRGTRDPSWGDAARRVHATARARVSDVLGRSGRATAPPADAVLAVVHGAVLGALVDGADADEARRRAAAALAVALRGD